MYMKLQSLETTSLHELPPEGILGENAQLLSSFLCRVLLERRVEGGGVGNQ